MAGDDAGDIRWAERLTAQGWGYYRAAFTHGRKLWDYALAAFEQAEGLYRRANVTEGREGLAQALSGRATVLRSSGLPDAIREAVGLHREAIAILRELEAKEGLAEGLVNLALAYRDLVTVDPGAGSELGEAVEACREALDISKETGRPEDRALAACTLADISALLARLDDDAYRERHLAEALGFYGQAEKLWQDNDRDGLALARMGLAEAYVALGKNLEGARDLLDEVERYYIDYSGSPVRGPVRYQLAQVKELRARLLEAEGRSEEARALRQEALDGLEALGFKPN
ncbi:MAG: hypothetical protein C4551_05675 [Bacillota bacterium]|nr:MAG: hypothetical protein C4551_05675 [Bacillota bacterium]